MMARTSAARRKGAATALQTAGRPVFIVDGARTPFLKAGTRPGPFSPVDLAVQCGRPLLARQPFAPSDIDEVILGCVNVPADEVNPGRVAALRLGCGPEVPGWTVQRNCASGQQSIDTAWRRRFPTPFAIPPLHATGCAKAFTWPMTSNWAASIVPSG